MNDKLFALFDAGIVIVAVVVFAVWQLVSVNHEIAADRRRSEEATRHPVGEHG